MAPQSLVKKKEICIKELRCWHLIQRFRCRKQDSTLRGSMCLDKYPGVKDVKRGRWLVGKGVALSCAELKD